MRHKAISLWNPWAVFWVHGIKKYETRSWDLKYDGPLLIHAAKRIERIEDHYFHSALEILGMEYDDLPRGAIIGKCDRIISKMITEFNRPDDPLEMALGNFRVCRFMWEPVNMQTLETPIPARGKQGLWNYIPPGTYPHPLKKESQKQLELF